MIESKIIAACPDPPNWYGAFNHARQHALVERDGSLCTYCGVELILWCDPRRVYVEQNIDGSPKYKAPEDLRFATTDHIIPRSRGGTEEMENVCLACPRCNSKKADKLLEEWVRP